MLNYFGKQPLIRAQLGGGIISCEAVNTGGSLRGGELEAINNSEGLREAEERVSCQAMRTFSPLPVGNTVHPSFQPQVYWRSAV